MSYSDPKLVAFLCAYAALTILIVFGVRTVKAILNADPSLARTALTEPNTPTPGATDGAGGEAPEDKGSFSRVAGAFGAMILCAVVAALSYWVLYALFYDPDALAKVSSLWKYLTAASALFAPYAVNQLTSIFKP